MLVKLIQLAPAVRAEGILTMNLIAAARTAAILFRRGRWLVVRDLGAAIRAEQVTRFKRLPAVRADRWRGCS